MFTPQEIQERSDSLEKAVFGGYSMSSVEELLTPLAQDYASLYKENAVLKSKMKVLVERLEEYRKQEEGINRALLAAQKTADELVSEAERKSAKMIADTEQKLRQRSQELKDEVAAETERVALAKQAAAKFIVEIEDRVQGQLSQLEKIKQMDLTVREDTSTSKTERKATKLSTSSKNPLFKKAAAKEQTEEAKKTTKASEDDMARQIEENISRILEEAAKPEQTAQKDFGDTRVIDPVG